jgi:LPS export ABC transporter permease LptG
MILGRVDRYIFSAPVPYFFISLTLFTLILVIQQATKFAELVSSSQFPFEVTLRLVLLIIPGVLLFTVPMAAMVGTAVGYSRLLNDSELTALSAGGVSTYRCLRPALWGGALLLALCLYTGFVLIPATARQLRQTAGEILLEKMVSPVEPRSFLTGFPGKVMEDGTWRNIFIHWRAEQGDLRLITAEGGRLNASADGIELYLRNAIVTNIDRAEQITAERASELHLRDERLDQYRSAFVERLRNRELSKDELGWPELSRQASSSGDARERTEAQLALHKRLALCASPFVLALVGALTILRAKRGGKLSGIFISVILMLLYYLLFLAGEQLARGMVLPPAYGLWLAPLGFLLLAGLLLFTRPRGFGRGKGIGATALTRLLPAFKPHVAQGTAVGLFDRYVLKSLLKLFVGMLLTLNFIFLLFTLFELLKFISRNEIAAKTVSTYLLFLTPYSTLFLTPACTFLAVLIGFALMIRRSESVIWLSTGLSVNRIIAPALLFSLSVGLGAHFLQQSVSPAANKRQNDLRRYIRSGERTLAAQNGETWVSVPEERRIYLVAFRRESPGARLERVSYYEFDESGKHLKRVFRSAAVAELPESRVRLTGTAYDLGPRGVLTAEFSEISSAPEHIQALNESGWAAEELSTKELSDNLRLLKAAGADTAPAAVELERRRTIILTPLVLALLAAPFTFLQTRQRLTNGIYYAVAAMLLYLLLSQICQNLGASGYLPPTIAVWSVPILFSSFGLYLLTRVRT